MKNFKITARHAQGEPGRTLLELEGRLDDSTVTELEDLWRDLQPENFSYLIVDFQKVSHISEFMGGFLAGLLQARQNPHLQVELRNVPTSLRPSLDRLPLPLAGVSFRGEAEKSPGADAGNQERAVHHFHLFPEKSRVISGVPFQLKVEARDASDRPATTYVGNPHMISDRGMISPTLLQPFSQGAWSGPTILTGPGPVVIRVWDDCSAGQLALEVVEEGEPVNFPVEVQCPGCHKVNIAGKADIFRCVQCNQIYYVDARSHVVPLKPSRKSGFVKELEFKIPSDINYLNHVRNFIVGISREENIGEEKISQVEMSLDEALANVVEHAYAFDDHQDIQVKVSLHTDRLEIVITDHGRSFDNDSLPLPDIHEHIAKRRVGGLGRYLMNTLMDEVQYRSDHYTNVLRMIKRF